MHEREGRPLTLRPACVGARPLRKLYICAIMHTVAPAVQFRLGHLAFAWDIAKAEANIVRHGITFEEAATTWLDPLAVERLDEEHSDTEDRWLRLGWTLRGALLVVWSTEREMKSRTVIRIIGARRATRRERDLYEEQSKTR